MRKSLTALIIFIVIFLWGAFGKAEAQSASADADVQSHQSFSPTFQGGESKRNMPGNSMPGFPNMPSNFAQPLMTHEFMSLAKFAEAKMEWTYEDIVNWSKDSDHVKVETEGRSTRSAHQSSDKLKLVLGKPKEYEFIGFIVGRATKKDTSMEAVFSRLAMTGLEKGGNILVPLNEGAKRVLSASAWGISLGFTQMTMSKGSERAVGAGSVGVGFTKGQSAYRHEPFARVMVARVSPALYEKLGAVGDRESKLEMENEKLKHQMRQMQQQFHQMQQQQQQQQK
ncbi:MAG: hypothetical protein ACLFTS_00375 [Candidatus Paceibacterota bacterium]